jgi:hypothetical protein
VTDAPVRSQADIGDLPLDSLELRIEGLLA